jgi:ribonuclease BN (tRNA processing enzyme)
MRLTFAGSGDAFGSGGRFNTCFHVAHSGGAFLIDCGASSLIALKRLGLDPAAIDTIFISHLHGDHFGGLPFFLIDGRLVGKRTAPLTIAGPQGTGERLDRAMEVMFPGSGRSKLGFDLSVVELPAGETRDVGQIAVTTAEMRHPSGAPSLALRLTCDRRTVAYSGDTEWVEDLVAIAAGADLFICECYQYDHPVRYHLDHATLARRRGDLTARRTVLTHMSDAMLAKLDSAAFETAFDGMEIDL